MSTRATQERLIGRFSQRDIRDAVADMFRREGLSMLSDEQVQEIATELATQHRISMRMNRANRAWAKAASHTERAVA